jgi:hypothetical protein
MVGLGGLRTLAVLAGSVCLPWRRGTVLPALKVLRERRDYIVMKSSLNSGLSQPGRRPAGVRHGW